MYKGKNSKVVDNRDVRQHRKDGWVFQKPSPVEKPARTRRPRATLKADPIVKQVIIPINHHDVFTQITLL